jgi:YVTN family beta-propeller protein
MNTHCYPTLHIAVLLVGLQACAPSEQAMKSASKTGVNTAPIAGAAGSGTAAAENPAPAVRQGRKAYIGLFGDAAIGVLDTENKRILTTVPVTAPDGIAITPDGMKVFVSSSDSGSVKVLDTATDTIAASIDVGAKPAGLTITPDGALVVAAVGGADEAVIIDVSRNAVARHVAVGQAHSSCVTSDGHYAYVGSQVTGSPAIVKVDLDADTPTQVLAVDKSPRALACEADRIYFTVVGLDAVEVLDPRTGQLGTPIPSGGSPHDVRAAQPGQTELAVSQTAGDLEFIDVPSAALVAHVPTGKLAHWIAVTTDRAAAYVTNEGDNTVAVVDLEKRVVTDTIDVGKAPRKIVLQP